MTRFLLDTQVWLWMQTDPDRFNRRSRALIEDSGNELFLSSASAWEIAIKHGLGKLDLPAPPETYVPERMRRSGTTPLAVEHAHALRTAELPKHHRDPFDRLMVAQAQLLRLPIITADSIFGAYDVRLVDAVSD